MGRGELRLEGWELGKPALFIASVESELELECPCARFRIEYLCRRQGLATRRSGRSESPD